MLSIKLTARAVLLLFHNCKNEWINVCVMKISNIHSQMWYEGWLCATVSLSYNLWKTMNIRVTNAETNGHASIQNVFKKKNMFRDPEYSCSALNFWRLPFFWYTSEATLMLPRFCKLWASFYLTLWWELRGIYCVMNERLFVYLEISLSVRHIAMCCGGG